MILRCLWAHRVKVWVVLRLDRSKPLLMVISEKLVSQVDVHDQDNPLVLLRNNARTRSPRIAP